MKFPTKQSKTAQCYLITFLSSSKITENCYVDLEAFFKNPQY